MQYLAFEFPSREEAQTVFQKLWDSHGVTGEISVSPVKEGRWRLEISSEKDVKESTIAGYAQYRVEAGD